MDVNDLLFKSLIDLPARVEKLQTEVYQQRLLIDVLLERSGLDAAGVERAHAWAEGAWKEVTEKMMAHHAAEFAATPEGQAAIEAHREERRRRERDFWRDDCKEAGRILPDPTAGDGKNA